MDGIQLIESHDELRKVSDELKQHNHLGIDTESDGFHSYFEKLCLVQISTPKRDIIVDTLAVSDLAPLKEVFENPSIQKILHASSNDILAFQRDYDLRLKNIFDTSVAWHLLGHKRCGLAHVLRKEFQAEHPKKSKYQRCNWSIRPLSTGQLEYARLDTHYLIPLRHSLSRHLMEKGLLEKAEEGFKQLEELTFEPKKPDPKAHLKIKGAKELDCEGKYILKALCRFRDRLAKHQDRSPFRIITNESMLQLARNNPQNLQDLLQVPGLPRRFREGQAEELLSVIRNANGRFNKYTGS